eukprot:CAMPEP_0118665316 /NCGR_PEP_ID=MMETSP0785-20121206/18551_1 /TAXON_ID=91992 /ORGANISM="Bolidomonas pacifica, Strain CCMP 1866" /LENGTH=103 /DNA_ID=CAMNT_0006559421 /DNA_START=77 /DNA_END=385 /DNA_ORIENTATION=+
MTKKHERSSPPSSPSPSSPPSKKAKPSSTPTPTKSTLSQRFITSSILSSHNPTSEWVDLEVGKDELRAAYTINSGQTFAWRAVDSGDNSVASEVSTAWGSVTG